MNNESQGATITANADFFNKIGTKQTHTDVSLLMYQTQTDFEGIDEIAALRSLLVVIPFLSVLEPVFILVEEFQQPVAIEPNLLFRGYVEFTFRGWPASDHHAMHPHRQVR